MAFCQCDSTFCVAPIFAPSTANAEGATRKEEELAALARNLYKALPRL